MTKIISDNCGFGHTTITFEGYAELEHAASYLSGRSSNAMWDRPYLGDYNKAYSFLKDVHSAAVSFCMGGGSIPDYETIEIIKEV